MILSNRLRLPPAVYFFWTVCIYGWQGWTMPTWIAVGLCVALLIAQWPKNMEGSDVAKPT